MHICLRWKSREKREPQDGRSLFERFMAQMLMDAGAARATGELQSGEGPPVETPQGWDAEKAVLRYSNPVTTISHSRLSRVRAVAYLRVSKLHPTIKILSEK